MHVTRVTKYPTLQRKTGGISNAYRYRSGIRYLLTSGIDGITGTTVFSVILP